MKKRIIPLLLLIAFLMTTPGNAAGKRPKYKELKAINQNLVVSLDSLAREVEVLKGILYKVYEENDSLKIALNTTADRLDDERIFQGPVPDSLWMSGPEVDDSLEVERFTSDVSDSVMIERLTALGTRVALPYNSTVRSYIVKYSERYSEGVGRMLGEAKYYFPIFENILSKYELPLELKYMSIIESALKTKARSVSGARGLWQFMYSAAKGYGLNVDSYVDERMDTYKATDAAARFLKDSYNRFGDWALAIASYNCGPGSVLRAIKVAGKSDFWSIYPYLPAETRGYLPAFVGAMYAMEYYKEYGIEPGPAPFDGEEIAAVAIDRKLHFTQLSEVLGIPVSTVEELNSQYIHNIIPGSPEHKYVLLLPRSYMDRFEQEVPDSIFNYKAEELFTKTVIVGRDQPSVKSTKSSRKDKAKGSKSKSKTGKKGSTVSYTVKSGDSLSRIAKRNGTTVEKIKRANGLKSDKVVVGKKLVIPKK